MGIVRIGIDDTDSKHGMCTTYVGSVVADRLKSQGFKLNSWPRLVRLNPNWHLKTRGNCAISLNIECSYSEFPKLRDIVLSTVEELAELRCETTNPGVVFYCGKKIPEALKNFSRKVIQDVVEIVEAERLANEINAEYFKYKLGRGIIGALAAIGEIFEQDSTYELLAYRIKENRGKKRIIDLESIALMNTKTYPRTFDNIDPATGEIRITPHTPCPILFGIRAQDPDTALTAFDMLRVNEPIERWIIYQTNQGTDAHLIENKISTLKLLSSAIVNGTVSQKPKILHGGHVFFSLKDSSGEICCAAYEPTRKFRDIIKKLEVGDTIRVYGGVKKKQGLPTTLNLEKIEILNLKKILVKINPICINCGRRTKSEGKNKGYQCEVCKQLFPDGTEKYIEEPRDLKIGFYEVPPRARRHLAKPLVRIL